MAQRPFVHLHCHTHYSLLDGANRIPELVQHTKSLGMNSLAITDHGNLYGAVEFYRECRDAGLNPIVGYEAYVAHTHRGDRSAKKRGESGFHLTLLAQNIVGFRNLVKLASFAYLDGFHYIPRIDKELLEAYHEGIICLSGCASSEFSEFILTDKQEEAKKLAVWFHRLFGDNFYVEIQSNGLKIQKQCADGAIEVANQLGLPLVATSDAHYQHQGDAEAHDVLLCINTGRLLSDPNRMRYGDGDGLMVNQFYVCGPDEMYKRFPVHAEAVKRSQEIADKCDLKLDFKARHFPVFITPAKKTAEQYLRELCDAGLVERYGPDAPPEAQARLEAAKTRLDHEMGVIGRMGFSSYFLIVWDFVRFANSKGIPAGARGSACGAVVSYVLKLSHVCPLEFDLLFERFLDPNRSEAPDIDIDFCQDRREDVIAYVREKYGESSVAQIATFGTMAAKAAIKDVGRVLDLPLEHVNRLTAMVPKVLNISLDDSLKQSPDLKREYDTNPEVRRLIDIALKLEGTNRNVGTHAAGVVIANGPIIDYVPVQRMQRKDGSTKTGESVITTQWVMGDLEKVGMLKMDFLGLRTLTVVDNTLKLIRKSKVGARGLEAIKDIDHRTYALLKHGLNALPLTDAETYKLLQRGDARGVFQLESDGIRELLKRMKPDSIRDLIATNALYRPGPLGGGMVDAYVNRKHGREKPTYEHAVMEEILSETYGIIIYQEQCMQVLNRMGGIELASAYACIKAISKKKQEIIDQRHAEFVRGAQERGVSAAIAEQIFDFIVQFAGYGFNKCVVGDTVVHNASTGERATVGDLFERRRDFVVHALGDDGKLAPRRVVDVMSNGRKPVFRLRTQLGKTITATANHPFRTLDGWTNLEDLKPGDRVAAPRRLATEGDACWPRHEIVALAGLLSEGNTCHPSSLYFYGNDATLVNDFANAMNMFEDTVARITVRRGRIHEVCANTGRNSKFAKSEGGAAVKTPRGKSGAFAWATRLGIVGKKAPAKSVPADVFRFSDADLELFLGRLWAGDGFIANVTLKVPFYATSSRQLAQDVQTLLLRLGIASRIHEKQFKYRDQLRPDYTVHVLGERSSEDFLQIVAPHCLGREAAVQLLREHHETTRRGLTSKDTLPPEVRLWIDDERRKAGLTWRELESQSGVSMKEFHGNGSAGKQGFRRSTIARLAAFFDSSRLRQAAESDVFWDRVVSIEPLGEQETYDLTVETDHNFVADGLIVHNSHSAAYAKLGYQTAYLKTHYPAEFMAALLTSEIDDSNKRDIMVEHIDDARKLGAPVQPPNIQEGEAEFTVAHGKIVFGLLAIKGLGRGAAEEIVRARKERGAFRDFFDFCERVDHKAIPKLAIERLVKVGAFDCTGAKRSQLMEALPRAIQSAGLAQSDRKHGQLNLFDTFDGGADSNGDGGRATAADLPNIPEWQPLDRLKHEKECLDFYISSHPLAQFEEFLNLFAGQRVCDLKALENGREVFLGGMFTQVRYMNTKKARNGNSRYFRCKLEDFTGVVECVMWPDDLVKYKDLVEEDKIFFVAGALEKTRDEPIVQIQRILTVEQTQRERTTGLLLMFDLTEEPHELAKLEAVGRILRRTPGKLPVFLNVRDAAGKMLSMKAGDDFKINPDKLEKAELETLLGKGRVQFSRQTSGR